MAGAADLLLRLHSAHQRLDAELKVGLGEHRVDRAVREFVRGGQHLRVDLAELGESAAPGTLGT